ncbi:DUF4387 domain-containing protein [Defluviimonas sp. WL0075]|uniref:DUF4387 domain-containing protein n=1 Tax=Albidovulum sediminicola TaxID=2984331 RepID=A0ABT2YWL0_9RHOB|nr:DUF4387 domain-containing protein [Defluviimonas sp. WL0075]MCV2863263.1 DUF4387 domain-containing protein [Defluviimonas sp. WL0075]
MAELGQIAQKVRSKNAGPFWLTVDIFCGDPVTFARVSGALDSARVAALYRVAEAEMRRFDIADLNVVKFSFPRPTVQGTAADRDMHGAGWAVLLEEMEIG